MRHEQSIARVCLEFSCRLPHHWSLTGSCLTAKWQIGVGYFVSVVREGLVHASEQHPHPGDLNLAANSFGHGHTRGHAWDGVLQARLLQRNAEMMCSCMRGHLAQNIEVKRENLSRIHSRKKKEQTKAKKLRRYLAFHALRRAPQLLSPGALPCLRPLPCSWPSLPHVCCSLAHLPTAVFLNTRPHSCHLVRPRLLHLPSVPRPRPGHLCICTQPMLCIQRP